MLPSALSRNELESISKKSKSLVINTDFSNREETNFASELTNALNEIADDTTSSATTINSSRSTSSSITPVKIQSPNSALNLSRQIHQKNLAKSSQLGLSLLRTNSNSGFSSPRVLIAPHPSPATSYPSSASLLSPTCSLQSVASPGTSEECLAPPPTPISTTGTARPYLPDSFIPANAATKLEQLEREENAADLSQQTPKTLPLEDFLAPSYYLYESLKQNEKLSEMVKNLSERVQYLESVIKKQ